MTAITELYVEALDKQPYSFTPMALGKLSAEQLDRQQDPIRSIEGMDNSLEIWNTLEKATQFHISFSRPKPDIQTPHDFIQIGRLYAAGYPQKEIAEVYGVARSAVRSSLDVLHRVMTWSLGDTVKQAIGLTDATLSMNDVRIAEIYNLCHDLPDVLRSTKKMKKLFKSNPLIRDVFEKLSLGKRFEDIITEANLEDFFPKKTQMWSAEALLDYFLQRNSLMSISSILLCHNFFNDFCLLNMFH